MKQYLKITVFTLVGSISAGGLVGMAPKTVRARALPVHYSTKKGKEGWYGLFAKNIGQTYWTDFGASHEGPGANKTASAALGDGTGNLYQVEIQSTLPWIKKSIGTVPNFFHFVPVIWISASNLYQSAGGRKKDDFKWIPIKDVMQNTSDAANISENLKKIIQDNWSNIIEPQLNNIISTKPTPSKPTTAPSLTGCTTPTKVSTGQEKPATGWASIPGAIYFYEKNKPYYEFTNFYEEASFTDQDGMVWPTSEHYFQAHKSEIPEVREYVSKLSKPRDTFEYFRDNPGLVGDHWTDAYKKQVMYTSLEYKFNQNPALKQMLLNTGNCILIEDAKEKDKFWGTGLDMKGENWLGRLLMQLRTNFQQIQQQTVPTGLPGKQEQ